MEIISRLANPPRDLVERYTRRERQFFFDYANYVLRLLSTEEVQQKLRKLFETEKILVRRIIDLRVMVFPARPVHRRPRNVLHGSYNHDNAQISVYPLKLSRDWISREGIDIFRAPVKSLSSHQRKILQEIYVSALTTLVHEVLHVKFEKKGLSRYAEEAIVRKLEKRHAGEWLKSLSVMAESQLAGLAI